MADTDLEWLEQQELAAGLEADPETHRAEALKRPLSFDDCKESPVPAEKKDAKKRKLPPAAAAPPVSRLELLATYSTREPEGPSISITTLTGRRNFIPLEDEVTEEEMRDQMDEMRSRGSLLRTPISFLLAEIEKEQLRAPLSQPRVRFADPEPAGSGGVSLTELWVQKYAPTSYPELLSDEKTNRSVLQWIKEWDAVVFGRKPVKPKAGKQQKGAPRSSTADPRPEKKVLLLHGPPGAGKTTLAHVLARQAGYRPVEINASDDRSSAAFFRKVVPALENESVDNGKPNLIVVDEIDGALGTEGTGAVDSLLKIVEFEPGVNDKKKKSRSRTGEDGEPGPVSADGPARRLGRPIICICNDLYAPALRKLREHALVYRVEKPESGRLLARLREVCKRETLSADTKSLLALIDMTEADIRACLNTIQFIRKTSMVLTPDHLISSRFGSKDIQHSIFQVWNSIFRKTKKNTALQDLLNDKIRERRELAALNIQKPQAIDPESLESFELYEVVGLHSDRAKVLEGCHVNYPTMKLAEPALERMVLCAEWLMYEDMLESRSYMDQSHGLQKYAPTAAVALHHLAASASYQPKFEYPRQEGEMRGKQSTNRALISHLSNPRAASKLPASVISLELISPFIDVLSPGIRPVNMAVLSAVEKQIVQSVVEIMAAYQLSYKTSEQGWKLDPEIDKLVRFTGALFKHHALTEAQKEHISREVEMFLIRLHELRMGPAPAVAPGPEGAPTSAKPHTGAAAVSSPAKSAPGLQSPAKKPGTPSKVPAFKPKEDIKQQIIANSQKLISSAAVLDAPKDFFGRPITPKADSAAPAATAASAAASIAKAKYPVQFKFQEGFTNAVRRNVYMRDFL